MVPRSLFGLKGFTMNYRTIIRSDIGLIRKKNEDSATALPLNFGHGGLFAMVADGAGGHMGGETASRIAIEICKEMILNDQGRQNPETLMQTILSHANQAILDQQKCELLRNHMGTTATALYFIDDRVCLGHVGDSRAYLWRDHELFQWTTDHRFSRHILTRALGLKAVEFDISTHQVLTQDRYLLCSDGLHELVSHAMMSYLIGSLPLVEAAEAMLGSALEAGGKDNITLVLVETSG